MPLLLAPPAAMFEPADGGGIISGVKWLYESPAVGGASDTSGAVALALGEDITKAPLPALGEDLTKDWSPAGGLDPAVVGGTLAALAPPLPSPALGEDMTKDPPPAFGEDITKDWSAAGGEDAAVVGGTLAESVPSLRISFRRPV